MKQISLSYTNHNLLPIYKIFKIVELVVFKAFGFVISLWPGLQWSQVHSINYWGSGTVELGPQGHPLPSTHWWVLLALIIYSPHLFFKAKRTHKTKYKACPSSLRPWQDIIKWFNVEEKRLIEAFLTLKSLFDTPHLDNMEILKALIYAKKDQLPLFDCSNQKKVSYLYLYLSFPSCSALFFSYIL